MPEPLASELARSELFVGIGPDRLDALASRFVSRSYPKNSVVVQEGDPGDRFFVVLSGRVRMYLSDERGKEVDLGTESAGGYFGEMMLDGGPRSASIITLTPTRLAAIGRDGFEQAVMSNPEIGLKVIERLIRRVRITTANLKGFGLGNVYERIVALLLDGALPRADGTLLCAERLTQREIADRVGASREMVGRILRDLVRGGYIDSASKTITIMRKPPRGW